MPSYSTSETIVGPATVPGRSAIAMLRISGPEAFRILQAISPALKNTPPHGHSRVLMLKFSSGGQADKPELTEQAVAVCLHRPDSYTGDDLVEISIHGNPLLLERAIETCLACGARLAEAGEFTFRAYVNGKLDLIQAEAVHDLINAGSSSALRLAQSALGGLPGQRIRHWQSRLLTLLSGIEMIHDYASDDLDASIAQAELLSPGQLHDELSEICGELEQALLDSQRSAAIRHGLSLAIVGPPNVGKSTLFNALLGYDRALVHHSPGTTRDYLSESVEFGGISFVMVDTAGQRDSVDEIESAGVSHARDWESSADLVISVAAASAEVDNIVLPAGDSDSRRLFVLTRCDLLPGWPEPQPGLLHVSGVSGLGIDTLREAIIARSGLREDMLAGYTRRQAALLSRCLAQLRIACAGLEQGMPLDALAQDIHLARESLLGINEVASRQDVIDGIFSSFCVGK